MAVRREIVSECIELLVLHLLHLSILRVRVGQDGSAGGWDVVGGASPSLGGRVQHGDLLLFALLLCLYDSDVFAGGIEGLSDLGLLFFRWHGVVALQIGHQVVDLNSELLLAGLDVAVEEHDVRLFEVGRELYERL